MFGYKQGFGYQKRKARLPYGNLWRFDGNLKNTYASKAVLTFSRPSLAYHPETGEEIPVDTPIYMDFAAGRKGSLMVEGVTQGYANAALMWDGAKLTGWSVGPGMSDAGYNIGEARVIAGTAGGGTARVRILQKPTVSEGDRVTVQCNIRKTGLVDGLHIGVEWMLSGDQDLVNITSMLTEEFQTFSHTAIAPAGTIIVRVYALYAYVETTNCEIEACMPMVQINGTEYWLPWHKEGTRAAPVKQITLPQALPATFAIGISTKMLHAHDTATRTFWQAGDYRCYFDAADNKIKMTNGAVTAETAAVTWGANDYVGIYAGRDDTTGNLFVQAKIAGVVGDKAEQAGGAIDSGTALFVASKSDGTESVNAVIGEFTLHDRAEDIDPIGFFSSMSSESVG